MNQKVEECGVSTLSDHIKFYENNKTQRVLPTTESDDLETHNTYEQVPYIPTSHPIDKNIRDDISADFDIGMSTSRNIDEVIKKI